MTALTAASLFFALSSTYFPPLWIDISYSMQGSENGYELYVVNFTSFSFISDLYVLLSQSDAEFCPSSAPCTVCGLTDLFHLRRQEKSGTGQHIRNQHCDTGLPANKLQVCHHACHSSYTTSTDPELTSIASSMSHRLKSQPNDVSLALQRQPEWLWVAINLLR